MWCLCLNHLQFFSGTVKIHDHGMSAVVAFFFSFPNNYVAIIFKQLFKRLIHNAQDARIVKCF